MNKYKHAEPIAKEFESVEKRAKQVENIASKQKSVVPFTVASAMKEGILYIDSSENRIKTKIGDKVYIFAPTP